MTSVDFGPHQTRITRERLLDMITWRPRRMKLSLEWPDSLHKPKKSEDDWSVVLPFRETLGDAFEAMCDVPNIGMREGGGRCYTFLKDDSDDALVNTRRLLGLIGNYVAVRDCLALSFALDYDREEGNPDKPHTAIGALRGRAKPYDDIATEDTRKAADDLASKCLDFLKIMTCYCTATCVVGMPPSRPDKTFDLPSYIAQKIAAMIGKPDLTRFVTTIKVRPQLKNESLDMKLASIEGTVSVEPLPFKDQNVLLIDDLYQSGISTNYVAMLMLEAGAKKVFGLACEKTCRNDDNMPRSSR